MSEVRLPDLSGWRLSLEQAICEQCDWRYLLPPELLSGHCPHCLKSQLIPLAREYPLGIFPPEQCLPFQVPLELVERNIETFAQGIWFAPPDLKPAKLKERLQRIYIPMWLVDSRVQAKWQAEAGFNYETVSHRDQFDQNKGGWYSQEIIETHIRWEPRLGRLDRLYHNFSAPALEEHQRLLASLGPYDLNLSQPYQPELVKGVLIRLPDRSTADAWPETLPAFQVAAAEECRQAAGADHLRDFRWQAFYEQQNWSLLLLPLYVTYYLDDEGQPQPVLLHGQKGQLSAPRRASMKRAQGAALKLLALAAIIFILSLLAGLGGVLLPPLFLLATAGVIGAIIMGAGAVIPPLLVWQTNRQS